MIEPIFDRYTILSLVLILSRPASINYSLGNFIIHLRMIMMHGNKNKLIWHNKVQSIFINKVIH
jgi:hypothetical protein